MDEVMADACNTATLSLAINVTLFECVRICFAMADDHIITVNSLVEDTEQVRYSGCSFLFINFLPYIFFQDFS